MSGLHDTSTWATYSATHDHDRGAWFWVLYNEHVGSDVRKQPAAHGWAPSYKDATKAARAAAPAGRTPYENLSIAYRLLTWKRFAFSRWDRERERQEQAAGAARSFSVDEFDRLLREFGRPKVPPALVALGLGLGATAADVGKAYRQRAFVAHPDRGGSDAAFIELTKARDEALRLVAKR